MINSAEHVDGLTQNACRFLQQAADDLLTNDVAMSVVHFYTAVELLLKARLVDEHWSLVLTQPGKASIDKFISGDIHTVGLEEAIKRIRNTLNYTIPENVVDNFDRLRKYRNQLVHFHGSEWPASRWQTNPDSEAAKEEAISLECRAWLDLYRLIMFHWKSTFAREHFRIHQIENSMVGIRAYLQAKFDRMKPEYDIIAQNGTCLFECPSCGYRALTKSEIAPELHENECLLCRFHERYLSCPCISDECQGRIQVHGSGPSPCDVCASDFDLDQIATHLLPNFDPRDGGEPDQARCGECNSWEVTDGSVVPSPDQSYYCCLSCLQHFEPSEIATCEWCGDRFTGDSDGTYLTGCVACDGHHGYKDD